MSKNHNKRRNSAFLYEVLILELTKATLQNDAPRRSAVTNIIKTHFGKDSVLARELDCYKAISEQSEVDPYTYEKILIEAKRAYSNLDLKAIFNAQTALINDINRTITKEVYSNFVPNYKHLATISRILHPRTPIANRVLFEKRLLENAGTATETNTLQPIDNLVYKTFVKKFNEAYDNTLLNEQKTLLRHYIGSVTDEQVQLKVYINEELERLQIELNKVLRAQQIKENVEIKQKIEQVNKLIETELPKRQIDGDFILEVLKIQQIANDVKVLVKD